MKTFDDVIEWLRTTGQEIFDAGAYEYDMGKQHSYTEDEANEFWDAAEILDDLRTSLFGEEWAITRDSS